MPRRPRLEVPGGIFHVGSRGALRQTIFREVEDRVWFLERLEEVAGRLRWSVHAYCLMGNHFHLIVETPEPNLGRGMQLLKGPFARRMNRVYGGTGHVFEQRYWNGLIRTDWRYDWLLGYVAHNPVRARLCAAPDDWAWSSFAALVRGERCCVDARALLARFERGSLDPLAAYARCVELHTAAAG